MTTAPETISRRLPRTLADRLFDVQTVYVQADAHNYPRTAEIMARFPHAEQIEVASHQDIPGLFGNPGAARDWLKIKRGVLILGVRKTISARPNTRSADFIAPGQANGCAGACSYCYVPRHKGYANPITTFVNIEAICGYLERHAKRQGTKPEANQADPLLWIYDIGENSDCSADAVISDNVKDLIALFRRIPNAKASFATKFVNRDLLSYDPQGKTRIRFSLMPARTSRLVDVRTSPIAERIAAINDFVAAGYEVHLNFSPVILSDTWLADYTELLAQIDDALSSDAKNQLACEIIFLTHNEPLHEINVQWHPKAEKLLWRPDVQEVKFSENGGKNVRYKSGFKGRHVRQLEELVTLKLPYCRIRYAF